MMSFQTGEEAGNDSDLVFDFEMEMGEDEVIAGEKELEEGELEDGELEEDEASTLLLKYEKNFDPDVDLSHLGDKVQVLLGKFQKDFDDGILKDSLGARYGGYGSFLPSQGYEGSPVDPRHNNIKLYQDTALRSCAMPGDYHARTPALPLQKAPALNRSRTIDVGCPAYQRAWESSVRPAAIHRPDNAIEQTSPEVQTQLSPTSILPEKSGEVNDVIAHNSATIMLEDIHAQRRILSPELQVVPDGSRTGIIENVYSSTAPGEYSLPHSSHSLCSGGTPLGSYHTSGYLESLSSPGESLLSPLPDTFLGIVEKDEGNSRSMASGDVCEVENQISEDSSVDRTSGDRRAGSPRDAQFDYNEHWTMKPHQRPGMNECEIHEEETPITLHESHQHPTPAQQKSLDGHPNDLTSGPASAEHHLAPFLQDHNLVMSLIERNENDPVQIESNSKRLADEESFRVSKKSKLESLHHANKEHSAENHRVRDETGETGPSVEKEVRLHESTTTEGNESTASPSTNGIQDEGKGTENIVSQSTDEIQDGRRGNESTASQPTNEIQGEGEGTVNIVCQSTDEIQDGRNGNENTASQSTTGVQEGEGNVNIVSQSTDEIQDGREANENTVSQSTDEIQEEITQTRLQPHLNSPALGQASDEQHLAQLHQRHILVLSPTERHENDPMQIESNRKRLGDEDRFRISKKSKLESLHRGNKEYSADNHGVREETNENRLSIVNEVRVHESITREGNENTASQSTTGMRDEGEGNENIVTQSAHEIQDEREGNENTASQSTNGIQDEGEGNENIVTQSTDEIQDGREGNENTASQSTNGIQDEGEGIENIVSQSTGEIQDGTGGNEYTASQSTNGIPDEGEGNENIISQSTDEIQEETAQTSLQPHVSGDRPQISKEPRSSSLTMDVDASCSLEKDPSCQCSVDEIIKEGNDLKDKADDHKNFGSTLESTPLYFKAALKFLRGAFLLEPYSKEVARHREITDSIFMYKEAANLCEFAASEYERYDKMAAAALAYKCMEVAHMRVVYSKATRVNQDRHELRIGLQNLYLGDSPSSSGSDLDNVYNDRTPDKDVSSKMAGYRAVVSGNRLKIERVLNFTKDVNKAMDASTKCQMAFAAAKKCSDDPKYASEFSLVKKAISSSFHEVDTVIYLVQLAMEAIND